MARVIYEVSLHENGRWHVRRRGATRVDSLFNQKADAVARARRLCRVEQSSQLVVRRRDNTIEFVRTYGEGAPSPEEPFPPWD